MIRKIKHICFALLLANSWDAMAQDDFSFKAHTGIKIVLKNEFDPMKVKEPETGVYYIQNAYPKPLGNEKGNKNIVNAICAQEGVKKSHNTQVERRNVPEPAVERGFLGALGAGIPNDNNIAVSNSGWVVSVLNTHIRVYDDTGRWYRNWSLESFPVAVEQSTPASGVGFLDRSYDPKIVYDPVANKFIVVYLEGSESSDTRIIIGFSRSNNPLDGWYVYEVEGNPFGGKTWSDYPIIAISEQDLYVTVNILKDSTDWRDGFTQSVIWQIPKSFGFSGDSLRANLISDIKFQDKSIWSICAIPNGFELMKDCMYFLSVRPGDVENDTVFLHRITTNYAQGTPQYFLQVLKADKKYGLPPDAYQPAAGFRLQSNDARVLSGFHHAGKIQYVQTTRNFANNRAAIYHGIISDIYTNPSIQANIISVDTVDFAYPSIAYAGDGRWNNNAAITFSHSSEKRLPGSSLVYMNHAKQYSRIVTLKEGEGLINTFLPDSIERWGDYTGIQRDYTQPGAFWTSGSFGNQFDRNGTWINRVIINDVNVSVPPTALEPKSALAYPNPVRETLNLEFLMKQPGTFYIEVRGVSGKKIYERSEIAQNPGKYLFRYNTTELPVGAYFYKITDFQSQDVFSGKFIVN
jgi:hypothetical protein